MRNSKRDTDVKNRILATPLWQLKAQLCPVEGLTNKWPGIILNASCYFCRKCKADALKKPCLESLGLGSWPSTSSARLWFLSGHLLEEAADGWEKWERMGRAGAAKLLHIWCSWSVFRVKGESNKSMANEVNVFFQETGVRTAACVFWPLLNLRLNAPEELQRGQQVKHHH